MKPEEQARQDINRQLSAAGWLVQDHRKMNLGAAAGITVREFPLETGPVDYLLYAGGKVIGVVEAKPEGHALKGVEIQSRKYTLGVPSSLPAWRRPPPFAYESTGVVTQFTNGLEPHARSREVFTFHRPDELVRLAGLEAQVRARLRDLPALASERLWPVQQQTIENLERSLAKAHSRALIHMATGSGKTFTAAAFCERLIRFAGAKRILFLVDRNTLGDQAFDEFQRYTSPYNGYRFTDEYAVQHLKNRTIEPAAKVVIATIQRLYAAFIWHGPEACVNQHIFKVESFIVRKFHFYAVRAFANALRRRTHGGGIVHVTRDKFDSTPLLLPPLREQARIVERLEELLSDLDAGIAALERARANLNRYRTAVLKAAVEGRLTDKWRAAHPDVEPASKLLERILAERRKKWEEAQLKKYADKGQAPPKGWKEKYPEPVMPQLLGLPELPAAWCWATLDQLILEPLSNGRSVLTAEGGLSGSAIDCPEGRLC